jgi:hypothetical protein
METNTVSIRFQNCGFALAINQWSPTGVLRYTWVPFEGAMGAAKYLINGMIGAGHTFYSGVPPSAKITKKKSHRQKKLRTTAYSIPRVKLKVSLRS